MIAIGSLRPFLRPLLTLTGVLSLLALLAAGCSGDDEGGEAPATTTTGGDEANTTTTSTTVTSSTTAPVDEPATPITVFGPVESTNPPIRPQPATALPEGYVEEEYFIGGEATSYLPVGTLSDDGVWPVQPDERAEYRTRILVRRPPADRFSGTVVVEWLNVTALEASPDWGYLSEEIGSAGHAYVAVSAQALGVVGGQSLLDVDVDEESAAAAGADPSDTDTGGLVNADPERYGTLTHPGDAFAYDMYTQIGRVLAANEGGVLGSLEPARVLAVGQSQSAGFLTSYINAVHPSALTYDGFLVHSRGAGGAPIGGEFGDDTSFVDRGVRIRTDLDVPVFIVQAETDLTILGYHLARQDDTDLIRTWELAGTAHSDAHVIRAIIGGPRYADVGSLLNCDDPINAGPHHEGVQAALHHLVEWASGGDAPPIAERIATTEGDPVEIVRDELGIALGGVRNPLVDVPVVVTTGDPWGDAALADGGGIDICVLFGQTIPIERAGLLELHGSADAYVDAFDTAAAAAVDAGFLLEADADQLREEAEFNRSRFE